MSMIRFEHKVLGDGSHVITSPDMRGLHVAAESRSEAERKAKKVIALIVAHRTRVRAVRKAIHARSSIGHNTVNGIVSGFITGLAQMGSLGQIKKSAKVRRSDAESLGQDWQIVGHGLIKAIQAKQIG